MNCCTIGTPELVLTILSAIRQVDEPKANAASFGVVLETGSRLPPGSITIALEYPQVTLVICYATPALAPAHL